MVFDSNRTCDRNKHLVKWSRVLIGLRVQFLMAVIFIRSKNRAKTKSDTRIREGNMYSNREHVFGEEDRFSNREHVFGEGDRYSNREILIRRGRQIFEYGDTYSKRKADIRIRSTYSEMRQVFEKGDTYSEKKALFE